MGILIFLFCVGLIFLVPFSRTARKILGTVLAVLFIIFLGYVTVIIAIGVLLTLIP